MKKIKISQNIIGYQHDGQSSNELGFNSYLFLDGKKALLLDTTYPEHLALVLEDLKKDGITITKVLPSHYHPDHIEGIRLLDQVDIYGSEESLKTLQGFGYTDEERREVEPTILFKDGETITFGGHTFKFVMVHGHSECSMFIFINDDFIHIGDTYMTSNSGLHSIPSVSWVGVEDHIKSLQKLKAYPNQIFMVSHGHLTNVLTDMTEGIDDRVKYLQALIESNNKITVEEALKDTVNDMINHVFHSYVK